MLPGSSGPSPVRADDLKSGALVQPFGPVLDGHRYHLVHLEGAAAREEIAALRGWLSATMSGGRSRKPR
ncbi:hypothetical protein WME76_48035 (plasmid) [Sorangium sp. So ce119]|uniref:hypothetical protein n=1 Tax=Sorangium sp. So ce119 TaxID=3133279 RepID=UPI003F647FBF